MATSNLKVVNVVYVVCVNDFPDSVVTSLDCVGIRKKELEVQFEEEEKKARQSLPKRYIHYHRVNQYRDY
jgi:hypothetical protein